MRLAFSILHTVFHVMRCILSHSIARHIQKHQQLFSLVETLETGHVLRESRNVDVPQVVRLLYHYAGWAQLRSNEFSDFKPYGVCGILCSIDACCVLCFLHTLSLDFYAVSTCKVLSLSCFKLLAYFHSLSRVGLYSTSLRDCDGGYCLAICYIY